MSPEHAAMARTFEALIERMHDAETSLRQQEERLVSRADLQDQRMRPGVPVRGPDFFAADPDPRSHTRAWVFAHPLVPLVGMDTRPDSLTIARQHGTLVNVHAPRSHGGACGRDVLIVADLVAWSAGAAKPDPEALFARVGQLASWDTGLVAYATFANDRAYFWVHKRPLMLNVDELAFMWWDRALGLVLAAAKDVGMDDLGLFVPGRHRPGFPREFHVLVDPLTTPGHCESTPVFVDSRFLEAMKPC